MEGSGCTRRATYGAAPGVRYTSSQCFTQGTSAYVDLLRRVHALKRSSGLCAAVYTEITDVESELAGLCTSDRAVLKMDPVLVSAANRGVVPVRAALRTVAAAADRSPSEWRYIITKPPARWAAPGFDDRAWLSGPGWIRHADTRGAVVGTPWRTPDIWLRRQVTLKSVPRGVFSLWMHHDEDVEVTINGVSALREAGFTTGYLEHAVSEAAARALHPGRNVIAVHCHQTEGGQFIDVGLGYRPGGIPDGRHPVGRSRDLRSGLGVECDGI